jgi:hypothetical protein
VKGKRRRRFWTEGEIARLLQLYPDHPTSCIAQILHRKIRAIWAKAKELGIVKSKEAIREHFRSKPISARFRATQFKKGQTPANKGVRRPGWARGRMCETQFKKGQLNGRAANSGRLSAASSRTPKDFCTSKCASWNPNVWPMLSHYLWEQHKGPIPPGHIVAYKDRDRNHCVIENLELISLRENMRRNTIWNSMPRELAEVIQLNGALKRKLRRLHGEEQDQRSA